MSDLIYHFQFASQVRFDFDYPRKATSRQTKSDFCFVIKDNRGENDTQKMVNAVKCVDKEFVLHVDANLHVKKNF